MKRGFEGFQEGWKGFERAAIERVREGSTGFERVAIERVRGSRGFESLLSKHLERLRDVSKPFSANPVFENPVHPALDH